MSLSKTIGIVLFAGAFLAACSVVLFRNPGLDPGAGTIDHRLVGMWYAGSDEAVSCKIHEEDPPIDQAACAAEKAGILYGWRATGANYYCGDRQSDMYFYVADTGDDLTAFVAICSEDSALGHYVLRLQSYTVRGQNYAVARPVTYGGERHVDGGFFIARYAFSDDDTLQLWIPNQDFAGDLVDAGALIDRVEVEQYYETLWVTATLEELLDYLAENDPDDEFWSVDLDTGFVPFSLVRIPQQPGATEARSEEEVAEDEPIQSDDN